MKRPVRKTPAAEREVEISYVFGFDAAHCFGSTPRGHKSYEIVRVSFR